MTTGPVDTAVRSVRLPTSSRAGRPGVAERDVRQLLLVCRLLGDVGALLLGLMVAQGIQQALMAVRSSVEPLGPVGVFNTLAILLWLALFANAGLYDSRRLLNAAEEFKLILQAVATGTVAATFTAFVAQGPDPALLGAGHLGRLHHRRAGHPLRLPLDRCGPCAAPAPWSAAC